MIDIQIVPEEFQYDVQSMVQAFYMGHPFKINSQVQDYYRILKVVYEENRINIILSDNEKKLFEEHYEIDCSGIVNHCDLSKTHRLSLIHIYFIAVAVVQPTHLIFMEQSMMHMRLDVKWKEIE